MNRALSVIRWLVTTIDLCFSIFTDGVEGLHVVLKTLHDASKESEALPVTVDIFVFLLDTVARGS